MLDLRQGRRRDAQDQIGIGVGFDEAMHEFDAGVVRIEKMALDAGTLLHAKLGAEGGEFLGCLGGERGTVFTVGAFASNRQGKRHHHSP
jgi:hypothetical protein